MHLLVNLQTLLIGNIWKALTFMKVCTKTNFFTGIFQGRFLYCKYFLKLLYFWKNFGSFGACNITTIRIHDRHLRIKQGNVIFSYYICCFIFQVLQICRLQAIYLVGVSAFGKRKTKSDTVMCSLDNTWYFSRRRCYIYSVYRRAFGLEIRRKQTFRNVP